MIDRKLSQLMDELSNHGVIVSFNGSFTQRIIEELGSVITTYLQTEKAIDAINNYNVFSVYIEQAQNIKNYFLEKSASNDAAEIGRQSLESMILVGRQNERFFVCSGNQMHNADIHQIKEHIDYINSLSKEQLKQAYKELLRKRNPPPSSTGLGIMDMARKAVLPLEYMVTARDDNFSFFTLKVNL